MHYISLVKFNKYLTKKQKLEYKMVCSKRGHKVPFAFLLTLLNNNATPNEINFISKSYNVKNISNYEAACFLTKKYPNQIIDVYNYLLDVDNEYLLDVFNDLNRLLPNNIEDIEPFLNDFKKYIINNLNFDYENNEHILNAFYKYTIIEKCPEKCEIYLHLLNDYKLDFYDLNNYMCNFSNIPHYFASKILNSIKDHWDFEKIRILGDVMREQKRFDTLYDGFVNGLTSFDADICNSEWLTENSRKIIVDAVTNREVKATDVQTYVYYNCFFNGRFSEEAVVDCLDYLKNESKNIQSLKDTLNLTEEEIDNVLSENVNVIKTKDKIFKENPENELVNKLFNER